MHKDPQLRSLVKGLSDMGVDLRRLMDTIREDGLGVFDLAARVHQALKVPGANLRSVARQYGKTKSWACKLSIIATGGAVMHAVVRDGISSDVAILTAIANLEKHDSVAAQRLVDQLRAGPTGDKRQIVSQYLNALKAAPLLTSSDQRASVRRTTSCAGGGSKASARRLRVEVALSVDSDEFEGFAALRQDFGDPILVADALHADPHLAIVAFGRKGRERRAFRLAELRIVTVSLA